MKSRTIKLELPGSEYVLVEQSIQSSEFDVALTDFKVPFAKINELISDIADGIKPAIEKVAPDKVSIEFGVGFGIESGHLTALVTKGSGEANLKISLEWS